MMKLLLTLLGILATATSLSAAPLKVELVSEVTSIQPGKPFTVGLHLEHKKDYHTYWKFPGIVGVATGVEWKLPEGWKAGPIEWPEPEKVFMFKIGAQGYHGELVLPVTITPPKDASLTPGTKVKLQGKATWMCCARECNPGATDLELELPVSAEKPVVSKKWGPMFAKARESQPAPLSGWKASATRKGDTVTLKLRPVGNGPVPEIKEALFFTEDGFIHSDAVQPMTRGTDGTVVLELPVSEYAPKPQPKVLVGVVQSPQGWTSAGASGVRSMQVEVPVE